MYLRQTAISLALLLLVLGIGLTTQHYTESVCHETIALIDEVLSDDSADCEQLVFTATNRFATQAKMLSLLHHHSYVDTITACLQRATVYVKAGFYQELKSELTTAKATLETLVNCDALTVENIF